MVHFGPSELIRLPLPQCFSLRRRKFRPRSEQNSDQNSDQSSDHARLCTLLEKEKLSRWSKFLGRENSDHGSSLAYFGVGVDDGASIGTLRVKCATSLHRDILQPKKDKRCGCRTKRPHRFRRLGSSTLVAPYRAILRYYRCDTSLQTPASRPGRQTNAQGMDPAVHLALREPQPQQMHPPFFCTFLFPFFATVHRSPGNFLPQNPFLGGGPCYQRDLPMQGSVC